MFQPQRGYRVSRLGRKAVFTCRYAWREVLQGTQPRTPGERSGLGTSSVSRLLIEKRKPPT